MTQRGSSSRPFPSRWRRSLPGCRARRADVQPQFSPAADRVVRPVGDEDIDALVGEELVDQRIGVDGPHHDADAVPVARPGHAQPGDLVVHGHPVSATGPDSRQGKQFAVPHGRPLTAGHPPETAAQRQCGPDLRESPLDRGDRRIFQGGDHEIARAQDRGGQRDDFLLVAGLFQVQVPDQAAGQERHHLVHPGDYVTQPVAEFLVLKLRQPRAAAPGVPVVVNNQDIVGRLADIELGVLRAAGHGLRVRLIGDRFRVS